MYTKNLVFNCTWLTSFHQQLSLFIVNALVGDNSCIHAELCRYVRTYSRNNEGADEPDLVSVGAIVSQ